MTTYEKSTERAAQYDGDTRESRAAFRNYDSVSEPVSKRTPWQIWRDACAWQFAALAQEAQAVPECHGTQTVCGTCNNEVGKCVLAAPQSVPAQPDGYAFRCDGRIWLVTDSELAEKWKAQGFDVTPVSSLPAAEKDVPRALTVNEQLIEALHDSLTMIGRIKKHCGITDNAGYTPDGRMLRLVDVENRARAILTAAGAK